MPTPSWLHCGTRNRSLIIDRRPGIVTNAGMRTAVYLTLLVIVSVYALARGGAPERWVAGTALGMVAADRLLHLAFPADFSAVDSGHLIIDVSGWVILTYVALRARRVWPLCVASLQTVTLMAHVARGLDDSMLPQAYGAMQVAASYPLLVLVAVGTYLHQRRLLLNGNDPPWRNSSR
jgi:hypothetical protein